MASNALSFIVTCKGRLDHLRQSLPRLVSQPNSDVIVVDYDCPDDAATWVQGAHPAVRVVKVVDRPEFNRSRACNHGGRAARTPWLCFVDADILVDAKFTDTLTPLLTRPHYLVADPPGPQFNGTIVMAKKDFVRIGGYDEVFEGWGWEDFDIRERLDLARAVERPFPSVLLTAIAHTDDLRTRFHRQKAMKESAKRNIVYMMAKLELMRLEGRELPEPVRRDLYTEVGTSVRANPGSKAVELSVSLPTRRVYNTNVVEDRTLKLRLRVDEAEPPAGAAQD